MKDQLILRPIAYIESDFGEKFGVPRQSGRVKDLVAAVRFEKDYALPEALRGIGIHRHPVLARGFFEPDYFFARYVGSRYRSGSRRFRPLREVGHLDRRLRGRIGVPPADARRASEYACEHCRRDQ